MVHPTDSAALMVQKSHIPVIDVRSPGEFMHGHIPGAFSLPVFDDQERAVVGTLYVQSGREAAILRGLDLALPKTAGYLKSLENIAPTPGKIMVHCWRGGLRSALMAEMFHHAGYEVYLLTGGYKAYRRYIREQLAGRARIVVVGGYTGSGKTELLHAIAGKGEQVIDLEGLANHKGSAFGALGQERQPTNEQFENNLYERWMPFDRSRIIWLEDESRMVGKVTLPDPVVEHITSGTLIRVEVDRPVRINRLVKEYSGFGKDLLADSIRRIRERLGGAQAQMAISALEGNRFDEVAGIVLSYYDKAYLFSMERRKCKSIHDIVLEGEDPEQNASAIIKFTYKCLFHEANIS